MTNQTILSDHVDRKDFESCRRDREIAEHKLVVARAELRLLQQIYGLSVSENSKIQYLS